MIKDTISAPTNTTKIQTAQTDIAPSNVDVDLAAAQILNDELTVTLQWIFFTALALGIELFGIAGNIINIICFVKQGFIEPINISFLGLSISDLGSLLTLLWSSICYTPAVISADLLFVPTELQYLTGAMPHTGFTRVTTWLTAFITLERCLCITAPLKVKTIVTQKRVAVIVTTLFLLLLLSATPAYVVNRLDWKYMPERNKTLFGLIHTDNRDNVEKVAYTINNVFIPFTAFLVITFCTITLIVELRSKAKWRMKSTKSEQGDRIFKRTQKVSKMVAMISTLFIVCFLPMVMLFMTMTCEPRFSNAGVYRNIHTITGGACVLMECINSSVNIFIYYHMSSKYKDIFLHLFLH